MEGSSFRSSRAGFSLLELLVALSVMSALFVLAVPAFNSAIRDAAVRSEVRRLATSVSFTRSQAIMGNRPATMCPSRNYRASLPQCSGAYVNGWIVFYDSDADKEFDPPQDRLLKSFPPTSARLSISNRRGTQDANEIITYYPDGSSSRNLTFQVCGHDGDSAKARSVILNIVGRSRIADGWGRCPQ